MKIVASLIGLLATLASALAGPLPFDRDLAIPPIVEDTTRAAECTVAFLVVDFSLNYVFAARMRIAPAESDRAVRNRMPCPAPIPPRISVRALDVCTVRAANPNHCVFADMTRGFEKEPAERNTASNGSRCLSDRSEFIGLACWKSGTLDVCGVACGKTEQEARDAAKARCEDKHQQTCAMTGAVPVLAP